MLAASPGPVVALFGIYAVHQLTRSREREKLVFELYKTVGDSLTAVKAAAVNGWSLEAGEKRKAAIAETKWRLQAVGAVVERMRRLSKAKAWSRRPPFRIETAITLTSAMAQLRNTITMDPFEDPERAADATQDEAIEYAVGSFLSALDEQFFNWMG